MSRPVIFETLQISKESSPGTAVAANIQPLSTMIVPTTIVPGEDVQASGQRADVDVISGKEHSEADISGKLALTDLFYWFSSALGQADVITASNRAIIQLAQEQAFPVAHTIEYASANGIFKFAGAQVSELSLSFTPNQIPTFSGKLIGGASVETGARTASPTRLPVQHAGPKQVSLWISDTLAGLTAAGAELKSADGVLDAQFQVNGLIEPVFTVSEDNSFAFLSETKPTIQTTITMIREGAKFADFMAASRSNALKYMRIVAKGPTVGTIQSRMEIIMPIKFRDPSSAENQGQFAGSFVANAVYDGPASASVLGTACRVVFDGAWIANAGLNLSTGYDNVTVAHANQLAGVAPIQTP